MGDLYMRLSQVTVLFLIALLSVSFVEAKFLQPDTLLPSIYDPQQLNRYAFARNSPYVFSDESGHRITTKVENYRGNDVIAVYQDDAYIGRVTGEITETAYYPSIFEGAPVYEETYYDYTVQRGSSTLGTTGKREITDALHGTERLSDITFRDRERLFKQENLEWAEAVIYDAAAIGSLGTSNLAKASRVVSYVGTARAGYDYVSGKGSALSFVPGLSVLSNWINNNAGYEPYDPIKNYKGPSRQGRVIGRIGGSDVITTGRGSVETRWGKYGKGIGGGFCTAGC